MASPSKRATASGSVASPQSRRWSPSAHRSPGLVRGSRRASSSADSSSNASGWSARSLASRLLRRSLISSSPKPLRVTSRSRSACRSARSRARSCSSQSPLILLSARFSSRACSALRSSQMTGASVGRDAGGDETLVAADDDRVLAPCEDGLDEAPLAQAAGQGLELALADATGLAGSGRSWSMGTCSTVREGRVPLVTTAPPRRLRARQSTQRAPRSG